MANKQKNSITNPGGGVFGEISNHFKLVFRLLRDPPHRDNYLFSYP
jgi:hypothetical protein